MTTNTTDQPFCIRCERIIKGDVYPDADENTICQDCMESANDKFEMLHSDEGGGR